MNITDIDTNEKSCSEMIYSEQFFDYLIRFGGDVKSINEIFGNDVCVNRINSEYAAVYKRLKSPSDIEEITAPGFSFIPKCYGLMDVYAGDGSGVKPLYTLPGLKLSGEGVIIGFVDTGIDFTLDTFCDKFGKTRILYIWDQTLSLSEVTSKTDTKTNIPGHFGFGRLFTSDEIDFALSQGEPYSYIPSRDENGHGTFLASAAAGRELGIAENSRLVVVKLKGAKESLRSLYKIPSGSTCFCENDIMLAVGFLIETARREGKPLVICLGIGSSQGAHRGVSLLEKYLDYVSAYRGVCVAAAVGNEHLSDAHFNKELLKPDEHTVVELSVEEGIYGFSMELWSRELLYLDVSVVSPTGEVFSGINPRRNSRYRRSFVYEGTTVDIVNTAIDLNAGTQMIFISFENAAAGIWQLKVLNSGSSISGGFDSWLPIRQYTKGGVRFLNPTSGVTICAPGSARNIITAAAYNAADETSYPPSSLGFNVNGFIKPDIAASGVNVIGAFAGSGKSREVLLTTRSGSSVSAAVISGMAALVLEWGLVKGNAPGISTAEIKQLFIQGAVQKDNITYPDTSLGWGFANLLNSFMRLRL